MMPTALWLVMFIFFFLRVNIYACMHAMSFPFFAVIYNSYLLKNNTGNDWAMTPYALDLSQPHIPEGVSVHSLNKGWYLVFLLQVQQMRRVVTIN